MEFIKKEEKFIENILNELGYLNEKVLIVPSNKKDLGQYQLNICMGLAKKYHENPMDIATKITNKLNDNYINVNISNPGFINFSFNDTYLLNEINKTVNDFSKFVPKKESKTIVIDYGGANVAKSLHVGHMRSANIGEALKRLCKVFGYNTIGDVHLGDLGRQAGMLLSEIKKNEPDNVYFNLDYNGLYPTVNYTVEDLGKMYVNANLDALNDPNRMDEVHLITSEIDKGNPRYLSLWKQLVNISSKKIKEVYDKLNCHFDLWEGELDAFSNIPSMLEKLKPYLYESNKAMVIDVKEETDTKEIPPLIVIKQDGATIYATRDLATIYSRQERFDPDEIWYVVDNRQSLYFKQVFRASYKSKLIDSNCKLLHLGFGTINGTDGKPYKTRDGKVMELSNLIDLIGLEIDKKMKSTIIDNRIEIKNKLTIATLKFADLMSFRETDYIFDPIKFSSFDGKTGPYILYTVVRLKSILNKAVGNNLKIKTINNQDMRNIILKLFELSSILEHSLNDKSLNFITDYLFDLCSLFNKFYGNYHILSEKDPIIYESYIVLLKIIYNVIHNLLDILAIDEVSEM